MSQDGPRGKEGDPQAGVFPCVPNYDRVWVLTAGQPPVNAEMLDGSLLPLLPGCRSAQ